MDQELALWAGIAAVVNLAGAYLAARVRNYRWSAFMMIIGGIAAIIFAAGAAEVLS